jgi:hypothetical protein
MPEMNLGVTYQPGAERCEKLGRVDIFLNVFKNTYTKKETHRRVLPFELGPGPVPARRSGPGRIWVWDFGFAYLYLGG